MAHKGKTSHAQPGYAQILGRGRGTERRSLLRRGRKIHSYTHSLTLSFLSYVACSPFLRPAPAHEELFAELGRKVGRKAEAGRMKIVFAATRRNVLACTSSPSHHSPPPALSRRARRGQFGGQTPNAGVSIVSQRPAGTFLYFYLILFIIIIIIILMFSTPSELFLLSCLVLSCPCMQTASVRSVLRYRDHPG